MNEPIFHVCGAHELPALAKRVAARCVISFNLPPLDLEERLFLSPSLADAFNDASWRKRQLFLDAFDVEYRQKKEIEGKVFVLEPPGRLLVSRAFDHLDRTVPPGALGSVVVNCWAGKSRSTAMALALMAYCRPKASAESLVNALLKIRPMAAPNRSIVAHADEILERKDSLLEIVDFHPSVIKNRAEIHDDPVRRNGFMAAPVAHGFSL